MKEAASGINKKFTKLLKRCSSGNRKAQEHLYRAFYGYVMSIALRYANSHVMAEEITNDSFLKIFNKLETHDTEKSFRAWLRRIVINTAIDNNRKELKNKSIVFNDELVMNEPSESSCNLSNAEEIIAALQSLSPAYRMVFNLYVMEGYSHDEIALKLDISPATSRSNLARAKMKIKGIIQSSKVYA